MHINHEHGFGGALARTTELPCEQVCNEAVSILEDVLGADEHDAAWFLNSPDGETLAEGMSDQSVTWQQSLRQTLSDWLAETDDHTLYQRHGWHARIKGKPYWAALRRMTRK